MIETIDVQIRKLSLVFVKLAGVLILSSALLISLDVITRNLFNWTISGASELSGYGLAISIAWSLPYCLHRRANIRVDSFYWMLPSRGRAMLDILSMFLLGVFIIILAYRSSWVLIETIGHSSRSVSQLNMPLIFPQSVWLLGLVWYLFAYFISLIRLVHAWLKDDLDMIFSIAGSGSDSGGELDQSVM